jgi:hypothetical protein
MCQLVTHIEEIWNIFQTKFTKQNLAENFKNIYGEVIYS